MRTWMLLLVLVGLPMVVQAQCAGQQSPFEPMSHEVLTVSLTPVGLTEAAFIPPGGNAAFAILTVLLAPVRYVPLGIPTLDVGGGVTLPPGTSVAICGLFSLKAIRMIREGTVDSVIRIDYYRTHQP